MGKNLIIKGADFSENGIQIVMSKNIINPESILENKVLAFNGNIINGSDTYCVADNIPVNGDVLIGSSAVGGATYPAFAVLNAQKQVIRVVADNPVHFDNPEGNYQQYIYQEGDAYLRIRFRKDDNPWRSIGKFAWACFGTSIPSEGCLPYGEIDD